MATKSIDGSGALANQLVTHPVDHQQGLLLLALDLYERQEASISLSMDDIVVALAIQENSKID